MGAIYGFLSTPHVMKRMLALVVSSAIFLSVAPAALAQTGRENRTTWSPYRISQRLQKRATLASYWNRWNLAYRRERYRAVVAQVLQGMPATLAVTGADDGRDFTAFDRPTRRTIGTWRLPDNCPENRINTDEGNPSTKAACTQADE